MSLEVQIETLNTNITALIEALRAIGNGQAPAAPAERPSKVAERIADEAPPPPAAAKPAPELVTFDDVKKAVLKLAAKDRKLAVDLLGQHGVKKVTDLPQEKWTAVCFAADELLERKESLNG